MGMEKTLRGWGRVRLSFLKLPYSIGDRGSTAVKVLCYKSEGR